MYLWDTLKYLPAVSSMKDVYHYMEMHDIVHSIPALNVFLKMTITHA